MDLSPRSTSSRRFLPVLFLLACFAAPEAVSQVTSQAHSAAVYRHAQAGQPTMEVKVWGAVRAPGLYQIPRDTDLVTLLALAGGPQQFTESPNIERTLWIELARENGGNRTVLFELPMEELTRTHTALPDIQDGDILSINVEARQLFGWRDGLAIISSVGTIAVIVLNIIRLSR